MPARENGDLPLLRPGRFPNTPAGFTLIELLTVIAIIAILATILIPVVGRVRDSARGSRCVGNLRALAVGMQVFLDDHNGQIEIWREGSDPQIGMWALQMERGEYLGSREVLYCPSRHPYDANHEPDSWPWQWRTYGFNMIETQPTISAWGNLLRFNANRIDSNEPYFLFADTFKISGGSDGQSQRYRIPSWDPTANQGGVHTRHGGRANVAFIDGRVSALDARELRRLGFRSYVN